MRYVIKFEGEDLVGGLCESPPMRGDLITWEGVRYQVRQREWRVEGGAAKYKYRLLTQMTLHVEKHGDG